MAASEQGDEHLVEDLVLADDDFAHFAKHTLAGFLELGDDGLGLGGRGSFGFRRGRLRGIRRKGKLDIAQSEDVAAAQRAGEDPAPGHDNAIAAAGVFELVGVAVALDDRVQRRDGIARHAEVVVAGAADGGAVLESEAEFLILEFVDEGGHGAVSGSWRT